MDLAEQAARRVFDLATTAAPKDPAGLLRHGAMAWSVVLFSPYQIIFGVTGDSASTCTIKSKGGRMGSNHFETYGTFTIGSVEEADAVFATELADWPERREGLTWYSPGHSARARSSRAGPRP